MNFKIYIIFSILLSLIFIYIKTKDKISLAGGCVGLLALITGLLIGHNYLDFIPTGLQSFVKYALVILTVISILVFLVVVIYRAEKYSGTEKGNVVPDFSVLFSLSPGNIVFWIIIIIINVIGLIFGSDRLQ